MVIRGDSSPRAEIHRAEEKGNYPPNIIPFCLLQRGVFPAITRPHSFLGDKPLAPEAVRLENFILQVY
jgi:hypothetical protein